MFEDISIMDGLADEERSKLESLLVEQHFTDGEDLLEEGKPTVGLLILKAGRAQVIKRDAFGNEQRITELHAPAVAGELELLCETTCTASVRAVGSVSANVLATNSFEALLAVGDRAATRLLRNLARALGRKLAATDDIYVDMAIWH